MNDALNPHAARAMRRVFEASKSGALVSEAGDVKRLVFFQYGDIVAARSSLPSERLGALMLRRGHITADQLDKAKGFIRSGRKMGQILAELGYLREAEIASLVRIQVIDIACGVLLADSSRLAFSEKVDVDAVTQTPVSIGDAFLEAVNRLEDVGHFRERVMLQDYVPKQTAGAFGIASGMSFTDLQAEVLDLVDSKATIGDIFSRSPLPEADTVRILVALHQAGVIALYKPKAAPSAQARSADAPEPPSPEPVLSFEKELISMYNDMQCQNHWQVLGIERGADRAVIERAHEELFGKVDPAKWESVDDASFQEKLSFVRTRIEDAYSTLSSQSSASVYDELDEHDHQYQKAKESWDVIEESKAEPAEADDEESQDVAKDAEEAARLYALARQSFQNKDFWSTIELCRRAIELGDENDAERYHLLGRALSENPRWRRDAERNFKIAQKLEPWQPRYLVSLGTLYQKEGLFERAERVFQQVRTIDPEFPVPRSGGEEQKAG